MERHAHEVIGLCRAMVRDGHLAEDLAQEVFSRAFTGLNQFRGEASPRTWLLAIARNRCIDHLRSVNRDPWRGAPDREGDPDHYPDERPLASDLIARRAEIASAMEQLTEGERAMVILRYRHGLEYDELAHVFGLREGAVRMRISRALSRMRRALQPTMHDMQAVQAPQEAMRARRTGAMGGALDEAAPRQSSVRQPQPAAPPARRSPPVPAAPAPARPPAVPAAPAAPPPPPGLSPPRGAPGPAPAVPDAQMPGPRRSGPANLPAVLGLLDPGIPPDLWHGLMAMARAL